MLHIMNLLELSIHILFVFDGPDCRYQYRDISKGRSERTRLVKDLLNLLGVPFHQAPAEAAPTCVKLQQLGIVDAVWTQHSVALACGCREIIFFEKRHRYRWGAAITDDYVIKYDPITLLEQWDLDQTSLILGLLLGGCEYSRGLPRVRHDTALEIAQKAKQLATTMCDVFKTDGDRVEMDKWLVVSLVTKSGT